MPTRRAFEAEASPRNGQPTWTVQHLPHRPGHPGATLIHVIGCTPSDQTLDREQALTALRQPRAAACRECGAAGSLTDYKEPAGQDTQAPAFPLNPN
ncbi:DUF6233 domain-containing protein [Streptomyces wuyuanensis]|uniref:DUF6233 domain-containing protein n=1 Tax=Streptomyces wuyuanensis TaxID=1196353 RepID=UPI00344A9A67